MPAHSSHIPPGSNSSLSEAVDQRDYWVAISDPVERRKAQNRLNQRNRRRKQRPEKWTPLRAKIQDITQQHQIAPFLIVTLRPEDHEDRFPLPIIKYEVLRSLKSQFPLTQDHLIPLIQFNVFRAILTNMLTLSITNLFTCEEPNIEDWFCVSTIPLPGTVPPSLEPTALQRITPHAPFVDLFPLPSLRDNLIRAEGTYDDCELCVDMLGSVCQPHFPPGVYIEEDKHNRNGLVVWGDPWKVESWEVEEGFVKKWGWMLKGCEDLLRSTDRWRQIRGEIPLQWAKWGFRAS